MRGFTARVAAVALALSLVPAVANAVSDDPTGLTFLPALAGPGDVVTVRTTACGPAASAVAYAKSLGGNVVLSPALPPGRAEGFFRVLTSAGPGTYTIRGACADGTQLGGVIKVPKSWIG